jgi:hypothetical protein
VSTPAQTIVINDREKVAEKESVKDDPISGSHGLLTWAGVFAFLAIVGGSILWFRKKRKLPVMVEPVIENTIPAAAELLRPAAELSGGDKLFYTTLRQCIWNFFTLHFGLTGSKMNSRDLIVMMKHRQINEKAQISILEILQECETGIFTDAHIQTDRKLLLDKAKTSLESIA